MATVPGTSESNSSNGSSPDTDKDFDPSVDMLVHDYDDERTMEDEENMSGGENVAEELNDLEKEGNMPLEQLLAMYNPGAAANNDSNSSDSSTGQDTRSSSEEEILSNQDLTLDKDEIARDLLSTSDENEDEETDVHDLLNNVAPSVTARLLRSRSQPGSEDSDSEADMDYKPEEDWKKTIQVGSSYQASVPEGLCKYDGAPAYENEDRLLWDPHKMEDNTVEKYLQEIQAQCIQSAVGVHAIPSGAHIRDDEQALYLLLQCGHNQEEALRRRKMQAIPPTDPMSLWSEEECSNFETGLRFYGKDFYLIHQNKVKTRSVGELVQFYYLWKKTERHDIFANKTRLEKRRYTLHPGVTDYMERFLDDQETPPPPQQPSRDRSASPVHSLLYGDPKRSHLKPPHSEIGMGDCPPEFQPIISDINLNTATPTIVCPEPKTHDSTEIDSYVFSNGLPEEGYVPPCKKTKVVNSVEDFTDDHVTTTASTTSQNHIDSLAITSVDKLSSDSLTDSLTVSSVNSGGITSVVDLGNTRGTEAVIQ